MRILWISRHSPTDRQVAVLREKFGDVEIIQRDVTLNNDPRKGAEEVLALMRETHADDVVGVLPVPHLAELTRMGVRPIRAVMSRTPTGNVLPNGEREYRFDFEHFERVLEVSVKTEPL